MGCEKEVLGEDSNNIYKNTWRFLIDETAAAEWTGAIPDTFVHSRSSADSWTDPSRAYFSAVRLNGFMYIVAGNEGAGLGPTNTIASFKQ